MQKYILAIDHGTTSTRAVLFDKAASVNSDAQLYKQAGNAVTTNVIEALAKYILDIEKENTNG